MTATRVNPICLCGCGRRVKRAGRKYYEPACVPPSARGDRAARRRTVVRQRLRRFKGLIERAVNGQRQVNVLDALAIAAQAYDDGYDAGYKTGVRCGGGV